MDKKEIIFWIKVVRLFLYGILTIIILAGV